MTNDYLVTGSEGKLITAVQVDETRIAFAQSGSVLSAEIVPGMPALEAFRTRFGSYGGADPRTYRLVEPEVPFGHYYERMARPLVGQPDRTTYPGSRLIESEMASLRGQLVTLMRQAEHICETVHPSAETLNVYGHNIRNLLILACTEVETHWRSVLVANGVTSNRFSTQDYVKLARPMRLNEYQVSLQHFPWLPPFRPFENWSENGRPTADIPWFADYNSVKHDREGSFSSATLGNALTALCACAVMLHAQFGTTEAFRWRPEFGYFFRIISIPQWDPIQFYAYAAGQDREAKACWDSGFSSGLICDSSFGWTDSF